MPMLQAIAIYEKKPQGSGFFFKSKTNNFRITKFAAGDQFRDFEIYSLPNYNDAADSEHVDHYEVKNEHQYVHLLPDLQNMIVIVSRSWLHPREVAYLILNIKHAYRHPETMNDVFNRMLADPLEFIGHDMLLAKTKQELDELLVQLHKIEEKILERGDKLEKLQDKSYHLTLESKKFNTASQNLNRCC